MTTKADTTLTWHQLAMQLYDLMDEAERRELYSKTCYTASKRWTSDELKAVSEILKMDINHKLLQAGMK